MSSKRLRCVRAFLISGLSIVYVSVGCAFSDLVFQLPRNDIKRQIYNGQYELLSGVDYSKQDINDAEHLHAGARYYLSKVYRTLDLDSIADEFLRGGWTHERAPWRYKAGLNILSSLSDKRQYNYAREIALEGVQEFSNDRHYLYYYLEALYWQGDYKRVLELLSQFRAQLTFEQGYQLNRVRWNSGEAQLWEAVSRYRGRIGDYYPEFQKLFFEYSASIYHSRVYNYIIDEPPLLAAPPPWELSLFKAKHLTASRSYAAAAKAYETALDAMPTNKYTLVLTPRTIRDIGRAYFYGGYTKSGERRLQQLAQRLTGAPQATALEWRGRLFIRTQSYEKAQTALQAAYRAQPSDRVLWLILDAGFSRSFADGLQQMEKYGSRMQDRRYYSDLFDRQTSLAVRERKWQELWRLRRIAIKHGAPYDRARLAVVAAEAVRIGVTKPPPGVTMAALRAELNIARQQTQSTHYAYLAGLLIGRQVGARSFTSSRVHKSNTVFSRLTCDELIEGYWQFHLIGEGYEQLRDCVQHYQTDELIKMAQQLYKRGLFNYAIRTVDIARSRNDFTFNNATARILYPRAYSHFIDKIAKRNGIPAYFFYSTIREESYFTSTVNSHAGAIGLGQFMPRTARAVARQMNLPAPDLTDPEQNLVLSGFHLRDLIDDLDDKQLFALAGYNAGIGRARRWLSVHDDYSDLLKHEAIHLTETRHYIRKIMVTNIRYARIYQSTPAAVIIKQYFTDLKRL